MNTEQITALIAEFSESPRRESGAPIQPDPRYVRLDDDPHIRGTVFGESAVDELMSTIRFSGGVPTAQLFTGMLGGGKTTELHQLMLRMQREGAVTIEVDLVTHLPNGEQLSPTEIQRSIALDLARAAGRVDYAGELYELLVSAGIDVRSMAVEDGSDLQNAFQTHTVFRKEANAALERRIPAFQDLTNSAVVRAVGALKNDRKASTVVVLVTNLEKLTRTTPQQALHVEASIERVFVNHDDALKPPCHVIYEVPFWLVLRNGGLGTTYSRAPVILPNIKVHQEGAAAESWEAGIVKLTELVRVRADKAGARLEQLFGEDLALTLTPLIIASGGNIRLLITWIRDLIYLVHRSLSADRPATYPDVHRVLTRRTEDCDGMILDPDLAVLREVARTNQAPTTEPQRSMLVRLLSLPQPLVLYYRNGEGWFDVLPIVRSLPRFTSGARPDSVGDIG